MMWFTVVANVWVFLHRDINKITYLLKQPVVRMLHLPNSKRFKRYFSFYYHFIRFIRSSVLNIDEKKKCQWLWKPSVQIRVWSVFNFLLLRQMVCLLINKKNNKRKKAFCRNNCYRLFFFLSVTLSLLFDGECVKIFWWLTTAWVTNSACEIVLVLIAPVNKCTGFRRICISKTLRDEREKNPVNRVFIHLLRHFQQEVWSRSTSITPAGAVM